MKSRLLFNQKGISVEEVLLSFQTWKKIASYDLDLCFKITKKKSKTIKLNKTRSVTQSDYMIFKHLPL